MTGLADMHVHQESSPRLDRILTQSLARHPFDWESWRRDVLAPLPPGLERLRVLGSIQPVDAEQDVGQAVLARIYDLLYESAAAGSVRAEVRVGRRAVATPGFMSVFRHAEQTVRNEFPGFRAEAVVLLKLWSARESLLEQVAMATTAAGQGLAGVDLLFEGRDPSVTWADVGMIAQDLSAAGLGVCVHAGEFTVASLQSALGLPALNRIGHAVRARDDLGLVREARARGVAVECCLTSNLLLGAISTPEESPIGLFAEAGVPVVLGTDDPVQMGTSIDVEYALAARVLGLHLGQATRFLSDNVARSKFEPSVR